MGTIELQNHIIRKVLNTTDKDFLFWLDEVLNKPIETGSYTLSDCEKSILQESFVDYQKGNVISNDELFSRNEEWLKE